MSAEIAARLATTVTPSTARAAPAATQAAITVRAYAGHDRALWNAFVLGRPEGTFFHRAEWSDVVGDSFGHRPHYLLAERAGTITGVLPLVEMRSLLFGRALVSTPFCVYGGILAADALAIKGKDAYDDEYFQILDRETRPLLEQQLSKSISAVASMIFGAWEAAGRPPLSLDPPAEVKKVRRPTG